MKTLNLDITNALGSTVTRATVDALREEASKALETVDKGTGAGNDFLGWVNLPSALTPELLDDIEATAAGLRDKCEVVVSIGIGGSYLGAKAVIEALSDSFAAYRNDNNGPKVVFAGQNIGEDYLFELMNYLEDKKFGIIVISKSGTTTEPAIAFRLLKEMLERKEGKKNAAERIVAITDAHKGALRKLATEEGYKTFVIDDNVGGRFSVLTPVGLLPIAVAGYDIKALVDGARQMQEATTSPDYDTNAAMLYAATRNALYRAGKKIEILVNYNPKLHFFGEWWKQLYGESEGKDQKGIFPASVDLTTDLHSMGQFIQDGSRNLFETVINIETSREEIILNEEPVDLDGLNYLAGKSVDFVNKSAMNGTILAHTDGQVPNLMVNVPEVNEFYLGELFYFFEFACGVSGYLLGVNPFNQPGVESYKKNMFALLGKPGYEAQREELLKRL